MHTAVTQSKPDATPGAAPSPLRTLLSLMVGFFLMTSLVRLGIDLIASIIRLPPNAHPPARALAMLPVASGIAAFFGGLAAGIVAGRAEVRHALLLAAVMLVMGVAMTARGQSPLWLMTTVLAIGMPLAALGGALAASARRRRVQRLRELSGK